MLRGEAGGQSCLLVQGKVERILQILSQVKFNLFIFFVDGQTLFSDVKLL